MANCPGCGGFLKFDIEKQKVHCSYCDQLYEPEALDQMNNAEESQSFDCTVFTCPNCGGELYSTDHDLSGNCSYCGSPVVFETKMKDAQRPAYIIPFTKTKEDCKAAYLKEIGERSFVPTALKDPAHIEGFRGIYVPYWIYDVEQKGQRFQVEAVKHYTNGKYDYADTYEVGGINAHRYEEIYHDASSVMQDDLSEQIEPFKLHEGKSQQSGGLKPFHPAYFSGFYAEPVDVPSQVYEAYARQIAEDRTKKYLDEESEFKAFKISKKMLPEHLNTEVKDARLAVFPVWFLSYRKKNRVAYAAVNGQTGRLISDVPVDMGKFFKMLIIAAVIIFACMNVFTILPMTVTLISVFVAYIATRFCYDDVRLLMTRDLSADMGLEKPKKPKKNGKEPKEKTRSKTVNSDGTFTVFVVWLILAMVAGVWVHFDNEAVIVFGRPLFIVLCLIMCVLQVIQIVKMGKCMKKMMQKKYSGFLYTILNLAASVYGTMVLIAKPANDYYYYLAAIIVIIICLLSFAGLIYNYNRLATRPLPQFHIHTGGDDRA